MFTVQSGNRTETGAKINDIVRNYGVFAWVFVVLIKGVIGNKTRVFIENRQTRFLNKLFVSFIFNIFPWQIHTRSQDK